MKQPLSSLILLICLLLGSHSWAQSPVDKENQNSHRCQTDKSMQELLSNPKRAAAYHARMAEMKSKIDMSRASIPCNATNTFVVPVAVHYDASYTCANTQCLIDAANAQIQSLNDDFAALNADLSLFTTDIVGCGAPNVASDGACITFCIATQNHPAVSGIPNGQPAITIGQYTGGNSVDSTATNGEWPGVLNMFVVDGLGYGISDGIGGDWSGTGVSQDGSFWGGPNFSACSSGGSLDDDANWNLGRTLTHEVGHYLGLWHVFQNACAPEPNTPFAVNDTPGQSAPSGGCPGTGSCPALDTGCGTSDFLQFNFMDYYDDACLVMFSNDQAIGMNQYVAANIANGNIRTNATDCNTAFTSLVACALTADFEPSNGDSVVVCADTGGDIVFTDLSTNGPTSWSWTFSVTSGGLTLSATTSSMQNPIISVTSGTSGTIDATLQVCDAGGNCVITTHTLNISVVTGTACPNDCNATFVDSGGTAGDYSDNENTTWTFCPLSPATTVIEVTFTSFDVENNATCGFDALEVFDGNSNAAPSLGVFCGTNAPGGGVISATSANPSGCLTFVFTSDGSVTAPGWEATNACVPIPSCTDGVQNGTETGVDCGGPTCPACPVCPAAATTLINENFDGCAQPTGWTVTSTGGGTVANGDFTFNEGPGGVPSGAIGPPSDFAGCIATMDDDANDGLGVGCILTPVTDITAYINNTLTFDWQHEAVAAGGEFIVQVWDGTMWVTVFSADDDSNGNNETVNVDAYANPNFQVQFCYDDEGGFQWGAGIDNISLCGTPNNTCPATITTNAFAGDYCEGSTINLMASPNNPNVTYAWSASSSSVTIANTGNASTTATLNSTNICATETVDISLVATCALDGTTLFSGVAGSVVIYPNPPANLASTVTVTNENMCSEPLVSVIAECVGVVTVTPDSGNPTFPVGVGISGTASYDLAFAYPTGPNCCTPPNCLGTVTGDYDCPVVACNIGADVVVVGSNQGGVTPFYFNAVLIDVYGGTPPYSYSWLTTGYVRHGIIGSPTSVQGAGNEIRVLNADNATWFLTVTDANGCIYTMSNTTASLNIVAITSYTVSTATTAGGCTNGSITAMVAGGSGSYSYNWTGPYNWAATAANGQGTNMISNCPKGWYSLVATDTNTGDTTSGWYWVNCTVPGRGKTSVDLGGSSLIEATPNPFTQETLISFAAGTDTQATVAVYGLNGQKVTDLFNGDIQANTRQTVAFKAGDLPNGLYLVQMITASGDVQHHKLLLSR